MYLKKFEFYFHLYFTAGIVLGIAGNFGEGAGTFAHFFARLSNGKYDSTSHESQQFSHGKGSQFSLLLGTSQGRSGIAPLGSAS